jgi:hypothetical protein
MSPKADPHPLFTTQQKRPTVEVGKTKTERSFSMSTVQKIRGAVQRLEQTYITKGKARRFACGVAALSLEAFESLNAAGRSLGINRFTGENRIRRSVTDAKLAGQLQQLLVREAFAKRQGYWYCSLDHSQFGPFCIAVLAVSVHKGRAIPVWCQVNVSQAALVVPLLTALEALLTLVATLDPKLKLVLVMDRWFASDKLFKLFTKHGIYFIARTKSNKLVQPPWDPSWWKTPILEISQEELTITYRTHQLRLVRSELRPDMKDPEPWFLLTNLPEEITRRQVLNRYSDRFEIEEAFKDVKWLQRLEWQRVKKPAVIRSLLLFVFLGWWLLWRYVEPVATKEIPQNKLHPKKRLSWFRLSWEYLQRLLRTPLLPPSPVGVWGGVRK